VSTSLHRVSDNPLHICNVIALLSLVVSSWPHLCLVSIYLCCFKRRLSSDGHNYLLSLTGDFMVEFHEGLYSRASLKLVRFYFLVFRVLF
jgi:hypothetical protein